MAVINTLELEGVSSKSWGDAAREALREAAKTSALSKDAAAKLKAPIPEAGASAGG